MGTINIIRNTYLTLIKDAFYSYFEPLFIVYRFFIRFFNFNPLPKMMREYELIKIQNSSKRHRLISIEEYFNYLNINSESRAVLGKIRINWIISKANYEYIDIFEDIVRRNASISKIFNIIFISSIIDLEQELCKSENDLTYCIINIDKFYYSLTSLPNINKYRSILESNNILLLVTDQYGASLIKKLELQSNSIDFTIKMLKQHVTKLIEKKIEEFISKKLGLTNRST